MIFASCLRDMPLTPEPEQDSEKDTLSASRYGEALSNFIKQAATPVTIGIQGGWGSGKTSLFSIIQADLKKDSQTAPVCIKVNAWEHSLFQDRQNRALVVFSLLTTITEHIEKAVKDDPDLDKEGKSFIQDTIAPAIKNTFRTLERYVPTIVSMAAGMDFGKGAGAGSGGNSRIVDQIHELRENLCKLTRNIRRKDGSPAKIVIFIDDLDRVNPATAVEILDSIKNIFDIAQCVFVLAIDYEVVVKGLESKYGSRTPENEREFRQYFDKIIQVPFSMPVGAYAKAMEGMLTEAFEALGIQQGYAPDRKAMEIIISVCKMATGGNPRGIKRLLNTLSLLQYIPDNTEKNLAPAKKILYLQIRFIIVALHLNFPEISRLLMENNKFTSWNLKESSTTWDLSREECGNTLNGLENSSDKGAYLDEEWEKVVFGLCAKSPWLKRKAWNVLKLLNMLRKLLNKLDTGSEDDAPLSDAAMEALSGILETITVVSVDTVQDNGGNEKLKYDNTSRNLKALHRRLAKNNLADVLTMPEESDYAQVDELNESSRVYIMACKSGLMEQLRITLAKYDQEELMLAMLLRNRPMPAGELKSALKKLRDIIPKDLPMLPDTGLEISYVAPEARENIPYKILIQWDPPQDGIGDTATLALQIQRLYQSVAEGLEKLLGAGKEELI